MLKKFNITSLSMCGFPKRNKFYFHDSMNLVWCYFSFFIIMIWVILCVYVVWESLMLKSTYFTFSIVVNVRVYCVYHTHTRQKNDLENRFPSVLVVQLMNILCVWLFFYFKLGTLLFRKLFIHKLHKYLQVG